MTTSIPELTDSNQMPHGEKAKHVFDWMRAVTQEGRGLNARAHSLALVLVTFADSNGAKCRPSTAKIATRMGVHRATVFRALEDLERAGLINRVLAHRKATTYELLIPKAILSRTTATQGVAPLRCHLPSDLPNSFASLRRAVPPAHSATRNDVDEFDAQWAWIERTAGGFQQGESDTVLGMLEKGSHQRAVLNKIIADRTRALFLVPG